MAIAVILFFTPPPQLRIPFLACFHQLRGFFHTRPSVAGLRFGTPLLAVSLPSGTPYRLRGFFSRPPISCGSPLRHTSTGCKSSFGHALPTAGFFFTPAHQLRVSASAHLYWLPVFLRAQLAGCGFSFTPAHQLRVSASAHLYWLPVFLRAQLAGCGVSSRPPISCGSSPRHTSTGCKSSLGHTLPAAGFFRMPAVCQDTITYSGSVLWINTS